MLGHRRLDEGVQRLTVTFSLFRIDVTVPPSHFFLSSSVFTCLVSRAYNRHGDGIIALISPLLFAADSLDERHPQSTRLIVVPIICLSAAAKMQGRASTIILFFGSFLVTPPRSAFINK